MVENNEKSIENLRNITDIKAQILSDSINFYGSYDGELLPFNMNMNEKFESTISDYCTIKTQKLSNSIIYDDAYKVEIQPKFEIIMHEGF